MFGAKQDDFDLMIFNDDSGTPIVYECYPDAFRTVYAGRSCSPSIRLKIRDFSAA